MNHEKELKQIAKALNRDKICWALGGSLILQCIDMEVEANDIDLLVKEYDIEPAVRLLGTLGTGKSGKTKAPFCTTHFYQFRIGQINIDVMAGLALKHEKGTYHFQFDETSISKSVSLNRETIPLSFLEDWYVIYQLIPGKEEKVAAIECYFGHYGVQHPERLEQSMEQNLPVKVRTRIEKIS